MSEQPVETQETQTTTPVVTTQSLMDQQPDEQHQVPEGDGAGLHPDARPPSNFSSSSGNTEESMTTFASQTLRTMARQDPSLDITFFLTMTPHRSVQDLARAKLLNLRPFLPNNPKPEGPTPKGKDPQGCLIQMPLICLKNPREITSKLPPAE